MTTASSHVLSVDGVQLSVDGKPVLLQGLSFFNAIYNPTFNASPEERCRRLRIFRSHGINLLRIWCQWDFEPPRSFVDVAPGHSLYAPDATVRPEHLATLTSILAAADAEGIVIEVVLFSHEREQRNYFSSDAQMRAAREVARELVPFRNVILQIWNEESVEVRKTFEAIKAVDPDRIVTNSPGGSGVLGDEEHNRFLDILTPHTQRHGPEPFWEVAARQVAGLLEAYQKPVLDDEPARCGLRKWGGVEGGTRVEQHIAQIQAIRAAGSHHVYHHDMFQNGAGHPATPQSGIPEPSYSPFHRKVFEFLRDHPPSTWRPSVPRRTE